MPILVALPVGLALFLGHGFYFGSALPFVSALFYAFLFTLVLASYLLRETIGRWLSFDHYICAVNLIYVLLLFPKPIPLLAMGAYFYAVYYFLCVRPAKKFLGQALIMTILPMILARSTSEIRFVGLSYITFRAFHLMMESHVLERITPLRFFTFLSFFPTVTAGPIDRFQNFGKQLRADLAEAISLPKIEAGYQLLLVGACMKFVGAEAVQRLVLDPSAGFRAAPLREVFGYSLFIYLDFAGYSAMAIGAALMLGLKVPQNFNRPFLSENPPDFWRRFHITLGEWLKDFFFTPLYRAFHDIAVFTNRPLLRQNTALFLTFLLMGCWNGFKSHFILSGALFGVYSVVYNSYNHWRRVRRLPAPTSRAWRALSILLMVSCACFALYVFSGRWH